MVVCASFVTYLLKLTHHGRVVAPGPWGPQVKQDEEAAGPHPGPPAPPPAPHGGRRLTGSPGGPVGARREEKEEQEEMMRRERRQGGTAWLGLEGSGWRQTQSWVSPCGTEAPWWLRETTQASRASGSDWSEKVMTKERKMQRGGEQRKESRNIKMLKELCAGMSLI